MQEVIADEVWGCKRFNQKANRSSIAPGEGAQNVTTTRGS
jgi:hypothetical protein